VSLYWSGSRPAGTIVKSFGTVEVHVAVPPLQVRIRCVNQSLPRDRVKQLKAEGEGREAVGLYDAYQLRVPLPQRSKQRQAVLYLNGNHAVGMAQ
jgi:hypothetical protein